MPEDAKIQAFRKVRFDIFEYAHEAVVGNTLFGERLTPFKTFGCAKQQMCGYPLRSGLSVKIWSSIPEG